MIIDSIQDVPQGVVDKARPQYETGGLFGAAVYYPVFPGSAALYCSKSNQHRTTTANIRQAFMNLSNDLFHIGVVDIDIEQLTVNLYRES